MLNLTQKERMLLQDQKKHEEHCIQKYNNYANQTLDPQLKQIFNTHANHEQQHLNTINQIISGQIPNINQQGNQQNQQSQQSEQSFPTLQSGVQAGMTNANDASLCNDMLMIEKYVSGAYDTAIFEFSDTNVRKALNHIQKEEQQHGEDIFNYMKSHGMYNPQ